MTVLEESSWDLLALCLLEGVGLGVCVGVVCVDEEEAGGAAVLLSALKVVAGRLGTGGASSGVVTGPSSFSSTEG